MKRWPTIAMIGALAVIAALTGTPTARADICAYPGNGEGVNVLVAQGGFCDYPTEVNGSHMHCEVGGFGIGGNFGLFGTNASLGLGGGGIGGASCSWRCPDGTLSPAPNPPGLWRQYLVPMRNSFCGQGHMAPNGLWSAPVLPTEGIPPGGVELPPPPPEVPPLPDSLNNPPGMPAP
jgi:hypothetical protein